LRGGNVSKERRKCSANAAGRKERTGSVPAVVAVYKSSANAACMISPGFVPVYEGFMCEPMGNALRLSWAHNLLEH
jgi:hypothetical protein